MNEERKTRNTSLIAKMLAAVMLMIFGGNVAWADDRPSPGTSGVSGPLTEDLVLRQVEESHPLLHGTRTEQAAARGQLLKALGIFEPTLVNDWELERLVKDGSTRNVGFNDTFLEMRHPWGPRAIVGFRAGIGDVEVADLGINKTNQPLLGIVFPLLRGFMINPEHAELERAELAGEQADIAMLQTRQDLFLGAATQFWDWVAAWKVAALRKHALQVAEDRASQVEQRAEAGAVPLLEVVEANEAVQRRQEHSIRAVRKAEQEALKLSLFLWEGSSTVLPDPQRIPDFPPHSPVPLREAMEEEKHIAIQSRPEILAVKLEAKLNDIDLALAENTFLPSLDLEAEPSRKVGDFVLGLGHRFGIQFRLPFLQREARGEQLRAQAQAQRLALLLNYRRQQVMMDIENARSAVHRAKERVEVSRRALALAETLLKGERTRFTVGATNLLFVNLRERNMVQAGVRLIQARADYHKALAFSQWASGMWVRTTTGS